MSRVVFESPSAEARVARASEWLASRTEAHVTVLAASVEFKGGHEFTDTFRAAASALVQSLA